MINSNETQMAKATLNTVKYLGASFIAQDNTAIDKDSQKGSVSVEEQVDSVQLNVKLSYDELPDKMKQLRQMVLSARHPEGEENISYGRIPDSRTEMVQIKSSEKNKEIAVIVDEEKGIYSYNEKPLNA